MSLEYHSGHELNFEDGECRCACGKLLEDGTPGITIEAILFTAQPELACTVAPDYPGDPEDLVVVHDTHAGVVLSVLCLDCAKALSGFVQFHSGNLAGLLEVA